VCLVLIVTLVFSRLTLLSRHILQALLFASDVGGFALAVYIFTVIAGFVTILLLKLIVLLLLRANYFSAFYRTDPYTANIWFVVMEVWNIALVGFECSIELALSPSS
jgi:hypothetical protein